MNDERWVRNLQRAARGYNRPPTTPRDRMWDRIAAAREETPVRSPWWARRQVLWPAAVVAALVVGLTIGRLIIPAPDGPLATPAAVDVVAADPTPAGPDQAAYRLAALPVLERSETLLLQVRTGADAPPTDAPFTDRARALLSETRLLLASPAADDPELAPLLKDLELALARLLRLAAAPQPVTGAAPDHDALQDGLERNAVLPRIRDLLATAPPTVGI